MAHIATLDEVFGLFDQLRNWGRWGTDDRLGTLNLITPGRRVAAARLAVEGTVVSCSLTIDPASPNSASKWASPQRMTFHVRGASASRMTTVVDHLGIVYHGRGITHIDAPSHVSWDEQLYNGISSAVVQPEWGAGELSVVEACGGILTRGVLVDVGATHGADLAGTSYGVTADDLDTALAAQKTSVHSGDALLLRTGARRGAFLDEPYPGWDVSALPWLHEHEIALIGCDTPQDPRPAMFEELSYPVHTVGLVAMGLWMIDNCALDGVAETCQRLGRWDFMLCVAPTPVVGLTGGPVNPLAVF